MNFICLYPVCLLSVSAFVLNKAETVLIHFRYKTVGSLLAVNPDALINTISGIALYGVVFRSDSLSQVAVAFGADAYRAVLLIVLFLHFGRFAASFRMTRFFCYSGVYPEPKAKDRFTRFAQG